MANVQWQISGEYFEACSCDSVCPCPTSGLAARPTKGSCDAGLVFQVQRGRYGSTTLDGLSFAVLLHTPGPMIQGNWTVGLILDERASKEQREALTTIASGQGGGPMAALGSLIGTFAGADAKAIKIESSGMRRSVALRRMRKPSRKGRRSPVTVFTTIAERPDWITSRTFGCPSLSFLVIVSTGSPRVVRMRSAVPSVARRS